MVPRPGIEPGTRGFSIPTSLVAMMTAIDFKGLQRHSLVTKHCEKAKNRHTFLLVKHRC